LSNDDPLEARAIERVQQGEAAAYEYLVARHLPRIVAILRGVVRNAHDAEDLAQEAFVKAYANIGRFRAGEAFGPWVGRIAMNGALDLLKHRRRVQHQLLDEGDRTTRADDAETAATSGEIALRIDAALGELPDMQRVVARLYLVEELGHDEIAAIMGLSIGTVRSHLSLARKKLRESLADLYGNEHA
jgi:RNA polymerase sigma-70 factor (ECF subfamily)